MTGTNWKQGAAKRRDARATKSEPRTKPTPAKKDTKKWCCGKVGREHQPKCMPATPFMFNGKNLLEAHRQLACTACGKQLKTWAPSRFIEVSTYEDRPDWVTS